MKLIKFFNQKKTVSEPVLEPGTSQMQRSTVRPRFYVISLSRTFIMNLPLTRHSKSCDCLRNLDPSNQNRHQNTLPSTHPPILH